MCRLCIAYHPEVQDRIAEELHEAGLLATPHGPPRPLEYSDLSSLKYMEAVSHLCMCIGLPDL